MPPKGSRGRGRGRGGAAVEARNSQANSPAQDEPASSTGTLVSTPPTEIQTDVSALALAAQQQGNVSPNLSPASAPTETPASTPVRAPVQRLDSLGVLAGGIIGTGRGTGRAMAGKFKPKAVRRGAEERAQAEAEERARREGRERALQKEQADVLRGERAGRSDMGRGRGMRGRGRGDAMGRGGLDRKKALREATGVFGIAPAGSGVKPAPAHFGGETRQTSTAANSGVTVTRATTATPGPSAKAARVKREPDADEFMSNLSDTTDIKPEIPEPIYPEEQEGNKPVPRIDIEQINLVTDDEEDDLPGATAISSSKGKGRLVSSKGGLKPVRLQRAEHKDRVTLVNTESAAASLADGKDSVREASFHGVLTSQDDEENNEERAGHDLYRDGKLWSGAWRDQGVQVKADPEAAADTIQVNRNANTTMPSADLKGHAEDMPEEGQRNTSCKASESPKAHRKTTNKDQKPVLQTEEDRAEYERHLEDIRILTEELGGMQRPLPAEKDNDVIDLEQTDKTAIKDKEGRLYLFQFPPLLPPLVNKIKKDAEINNVDMVKAVIKTPATAPSVDLTQPDNEVDIIIKTEESISNAPPPKPELVMEEGSIGKLIIRKSGMVELDWGGTILKLGRGVETSFLTTTVIIDGPSQQPQEEAAGLGFREQNNMMTGTGTGMGKVMGKFVATPDFNQMLEMD